MSNIVPKHSTCLFISRSDIEATCCKRMDLETKRSVSQLPNPHTEMVLIVNNTQDASTQIARPLLRSAILPFSTLTFGMKS
jgi:hypothetical protein